VLLALALCASRVAGQQASPLQGQGTVPDGVTDVYFSAYLERLLKVDDVEYQVRQWLRACIAYIAGAFDLTDLWFLRLLDP